MSAEKKRPQHAPQPEPVARSDVHVSANRCPFCRDDVAAKESVVCQECLTRHHAACWQEGGACSACQGTSILRPAPKTAKSAVVGLGISLLGILLTALIQLTRNGNVDLLLAVSLGVILTSFAGVSAAYRKGDRAD